MSSEPGVKNALLGFGAVGAMYPLIVQSKRAPVTIVAAKFDSAQPGEFVKIVGNTLDRPYAFVIVCTKYVPEVVQTSQMLPPLLSVNGLNAEKDPYDALKRMDLVENSFIISASVWFAENVIAEDVVRNGDFDRLTVAIYRPGDFTSPPSKQRAEAVQKGLFLGSFLDIVASAVPEVGNRGLPAFRLRLDGTVLDCFEPHSHWHIAADNRM
ncbi:hypothetical protein NEOLEDRAFT_1218412 [Neolentinus lepideus HHB14362 ss-1]|uniref:Uncharacterized protein n=1 Tax=Neolentinus lepideus HHB14362 ss-1 TaxID=1314782 RepID=A0A165QD92_9AGAM|nr:hypothetical protein NEOLEDRAFT_1218412 [Neolentinus lepideus HHB14362 ss-1]